MEIRTNIYISAVKRRIAFYRHFAVGERFLQDLEHDGDVKPRPQNKSHNHEDISEKTVKKRKISSQERPTKAGPIYADQPSLSSAGILSGSKIVGKVQ